MPTCVRTCFAIALVISTIPAWADDFDNVKQLVEKARQSSATHSFGARSAYLEAIASFDALNRGQEREVAKLWGSTYLELGELDESLGQGKDAEADYVHAIAVSIPLGAGYGYPVILPALKRQQVLYLRDGEFQHAVEAATRELGLLRLLSGRDANSSRLSARQSLPATLMLAKAYTAAGEWKTAKGVYDQTWVLAEIAVVTPPETLQELYDGSIAVYRQLQLTKEIDEAQKHFDRLINQKEVIQQTTVAPPRFKPLAVESDVKPGFKEGARPKCDPVYTLQAREQKLEGSVTMRFRIASNGDLVNTSIVQSSGFQQLDRAAVNGFSRCAFVTGTYHGQPVEGDFDVTFVWKLD